MRWNSSTPVHEVATVSREIRVCSHSDRTSFLASISASLTKNSLQSNCVDGKKHRQHAETEHFRRKPSQTWCGCDLLFCSIQVQHDEINGEDPTRDTLQPQQTNKSDHWFCTFSWCHVVWCRGRGLSLSLAISLLSPVGLGAYVSLCTCVHVSVSVLDGRSRERWTTIKELYRESTFLVSRALVLGRAQPLMRTRQRTFIVG